MATRANEPAFPTEEVHGDGIQQIRRHQGLTVREYFAARAMQGIIASRETTGEDTFASVAHRAFAQADAMLAEPSRGVA